MLDRCLHLIELALSAFKLCFSRTLKVHNEEAISNYRTWDMKCYNGFSVPRSSGAGSVFWLSRLINMEIQLSGFRWLNRCCAFDALQFQLSFSLGASYSDNLGAWENTLSVSQCVVENLKDFQKNVHLAIPHSSLSPLKSQVSCFLQSWWFLPRAFLPIPVLFCHSPLLENIASGHEKKSVSRKFLHCAISESTVLLCQKGSDSQANKQNALLKKSVWQRTDIIWNIRAGAVTATLLVIYQRSLSPFSFTTVHVQHPLF